VEEQPELVPLEGPWAVPLAALSEHLSERPSVAPWELPSVRSRLVRLRKRAWSSGRSESRARRVHRTQGRGNEELPTGAGRHELDVLSPPSVQPLITPPTGIFRGSPRLYDASTPGQQYSALTDGGSPKTCTDMHCRPDVFAARKVRRFKAAALNKKIREKPLPACPPTTRLSLRQQ